MIFSRRQKNILSAAIILMVAVFASKILGLLRDRLLAATFFRVGQEWQLDVYFAAFRIPDMLFQLLVLGALSAAFIPVFSKLLSQEKEAWRVASTIINIGSLIFIFISFLIFVFTPTLNRFIAPNFEERELALMVNLTRLMLISQWFFVISNIFTGILQSKQRFLIPALAPILYNLGIIIGTIFLSPIWGIYGPTAGVVLGAFLHFIVQLPLTLYLGFVYSPVLDFKNPFVRKIGRLMVPRTLALAVSQIELTVAVLIATSLTSGSLSIFYFAQHLNNLPVGLFGLTIGQAALPVLSVEAAKNRDNFKKVLLTCLRQILYLALPASVILLVLRIPLVRLVFGARTFPWEATILTGKVVAIFSFSIFAQAAIQILVRAFYALQDTKTPFLIAALAVGFNVFFSFLFTFRFDWGVLGLSLAASLASIIHCFFLIVFLQNKLDFLGKKLFFVPLAKIVLATFLTGFALWLPMRLLDKLFLDTTKTINLIALTVIAGLCGLAVYFLFSYVLRIEELKRFYKLFYRFGAWREILASSEEVLDGKTTPTSLTGKE